MSDKEKNAKLSLALKKNLKKRIYIFINPSFLDFKNNKISFNRVTFGQKLS